MVFLFKNHREDYNGKWNLQAKKNHENTDDTKWLLMSILTEDYYSEFGYKSKI